MYIIEIQSLSYFFIFSAIASSAPILAFVGMNDCEVKSCSKSNYKTYF